MRVNNAIFEQEHIHPANNVTSHYHKCSTLFRSNQSHYFLITIILLIKMTRSLPSSHKGKILIPSHLTLIILHIIIILATAATCTNNDEFCAVFSGFFHYSIFHVDICWGIVLCDQTKIWNWKISINLLIFHHHVTIVLV